MIIISLLYNFYDLFSFIFIYIDGKDVSNGKVYNTTDDSEAHDIEEKLGIGYDVLTDEKRVDLNDKNNLFEKFRLFKTCTATFQATV